MPNVEKVKEYNLQKGGIAEEWVTENWETTGIEYYLKDQDDGTLYHFFPKFPYWIMIDLGFSNKEARVIYYILAPVGEDTPNGDVSTWHLYNLDGEIVNR